MDINFLKKLNFSDKEAQIYLALLNLGPSSVRKIAEYCDLNRGTTYDSLKSLQERGVVNFYDKDSKQHFVAENPATLSDLVKRQEKELNEVHRQLERVIPELQALYNAGGERPIARYYSKKDIPLILEDILQTCEQDSENLYRIYSAEGVREFIYENFDTFSDVRIGKGISVKVIALGEGGELRGLDERKWLKVKKNTATYIIIYPGKTAYISLNTQGEPIGVVIENEGVYQTQKYIFDELWENI